MQLFCVFKRLSYQNWVNTAKVWEILFLVLKWDVLVSIFKSLYRKGWKSWLKM